MEFVNAIQTSFIKYFDFSTRSSRSEYWYFTLFISLITFIAVFIEYNPDPIDSEYTYTTYSEIILQTILIIPSTSLSVRRLHDINRSG